MNTSEGIVLHAVRYGDTSVIVDIFTASHGAVAFIVRKPQNRHRSASGTASGVVAAALQPLALVEVTWNHNMKSDLQKPKELVLSCAWTSLPFNPHKAAMSLFLGEFLWRALRREERNESLFEYCIQALTWLDVSENDFANFHIVFLLHLSRFLGFYPNADDWRPGDYFDLRAATFVSMRPLHNDFLEPEDAALLPNLLRVDVRSMRIVEMNGRQRGRVLEHITQFYRLHIPEFPEVRSLAVLADVFAS